MDLFTFHLANTQVTSTIRAILRPPNFKTVSGLKHVECMVPMTLGRPVSLPWRYRPNQIALFARWESESDIDQFLATSKLGRELVNGWHVRMEYLRRWGQISELDGLEPVAADHGDQRPVVAVTLARLKILQAPRFIRFGKPVEEQVRDNPETTISLAAMRPLGTLSTFSIWKSQKAMIDMVHGRSNGPRDARHANAMKERNRKDFHHEFTTMRFRPMSEHGSWEGRERYLPGANEVGDVRSEE